MVRLWPQVVRFLRNALDELIDHPERSMWWRLPRDNSYPGYTLVKTPDGDAWLYVFAERVHRAGQLAR